MHPMPTHHVYSVPPEVALKCCKFADLHQPFGPRFQSFSRPELLRVAREVFRCITEGHEPQDEEDLVDCIMQTAAEKQSHQLFMLQLSGNVVQGFVLLVPNKNLSRLQQVLSAACLPVSV
ncbi:hypothetical protein [Deinococcus cellulosilyticus]|uniref:Uncharacterized protein n=1 Tax=Deinococcus cellulosilyticus (strain DSM 18568 / NBRC 106333 / KACC 11606 / 5516J-15) TaxID=1223518 RepID=A0A511NBD8_DEIC1|nr:hypothetical protein [Deinococcus cellulosilyticus]GEM49907.1 hypothetical protein DC3_55420 [Deinococcus cellulosilyticus NBRC 106333 = KACC 11606]